MYCRNTVEYRLKLAFRLALRLGSAFLAQGLARRADLLKISIQRIDDMVLDDAVMNELALLDAGDQAGIFENAQMESDGLAMSKRSAISPAVIVAFDR